MRMRKKHNLEKRLERQNVYLLDIDTSEKDARVANQTRTPLSFLTFSETTTPSSWKSAQGKAASSSKPQRKTPT